MTTTTPSSDGALEARGSYRCASLPVKETTLLPRPSVARGGPVPELVRAGRWALPVWLLLVAAASPDRAIVDLRQYRRFATRCLRLIDDDTGSTLRSTVARVLDRLAKLKLITVEEKRHGHVIVQLLALDGSGDRYAMPRRSETKVVHVPTGQLFANGWHRKLTHVELAGLLIALTEETWQFNKFGPHQWEKSREEIARDYGLAASTWSKAKEGLLAAGLLDWDIPQLRPGSRPDRVPADRYTVHVEPLAIDPATAPRFAGRAVPMTITAPGTGAKLRLHRQRRIEVPPAPTPAKVVPMPRRRDA
jgi:hypothetical protein